MDRFSPKIEIINHFDDLIQRVDIDMEESLKKYNENQVLGELECFQVENRNIEFDHGIKFLLEKFESDKNTVDLWSESTKVVDYLNQIRMRTIEELRKEQKESVENSSRFNNLINSELTKEEKRSEIFAEKFYFQVKITRSDYKSWVFNLFTFVTDFYISQSEIDLLEKFINTEKKNKQDLSQDSNHIFDQKVVLIGLLNKHFGNNINNQTFPKHVIHVHKQDLSTIKEINFRYDFAGVNLSISSIDLSKLTHLNLDMGDKNVLDYIIIDSLSLVFLRLKFNSVEEIALKNLYELKELYLESHDVINIQPLFDQFPNIEILHYCNHLVEFEFKMSEKRIKIPYLRKKDLNLDFLINKFCSQTEKFYIFDDKFENVIKLLSEYQFPNLLELDMHCDLTRIEKKSFNAQMRMIKSLSIWSNTIEIIELDSFSDLKQLVSLDLSQNSIESLNPRHFSNLINLEVLNLSYNELENLDEKMFWGLKNLKKLDLGRNRLTKLDAKLLFKGLCNLKQLDLYFNPIKTIDHDIFSDLKHLVCLNLSRNNLKSLDRRIFSGLINLEILNLSSNLLKRFDENIFSDLKNLKNIDLSNNFLDAFDTESFVNHENLTKLNLNNNKLSHFDVRILDNLPQINRIHLSGNAISNIDELFNRYNAKEVFKSDYLFQYKYK